ncbi:CRISPR-associated protein, Cse2 family [Austwickia chelonae]|uniref:Putative CRISPR-associated protein n=1 Tax=Austwickia chelonae NBRC 105200 TaxID=1184607 RepID=K6VRN3_9MICO|nr:type I-E CRISPR-associated protein Cse2/CasB [Austwickia chelonae]GAB79424.1 putative CRISPR-associated protein [Austwickia chelonae NBRC 105200]SEW36920.1 CRISPR-associated protein, Cse2 family [Austwickia chelonae]
MSGADHRRDIEKYVQSRVLRLQEAYARGGQQPTSYGSATMAALRRADPTCPGDDPAVWEITLGDLPATLAGGGDAPSRAERAIHAALCLYATHQQSRGDGVHRSGVRFGQAVRQLAMVRGDGRELDGSVVARFHQAGAAASDRRRLTVMRTLVTLMRAERGAGIHLDYGLLARDLYDLSSPRTASRVRLAWGRDLRRHRSDQSDLSA